MKENNITRIKICPRCGKPYHDVPALSRMDNETLICPDCGTREALESIKQNRTKSSPLFIEPGGDYETRDVKRHLGRCG